MSKKLSYSHKSAARLAAVQILYQLELGGGDPETTVEEFKEYHLKQTLDAEQDRRINWDLAHALVKGIKEHQQQLHALIEPALSADWKFDRLELLIRCILQAAVFELVTFRDMDTPLIIGEYLKITEAFYTSKEAKFVNGVLHKVATVAREEVK